MHRKTNRQTSSVISLDSTEYFHTLFSTQCPTTDNGHHQNSQLHSTFQSKRSSLPSIEYPHVVNSNYPPVKSKTTQITDTSSPILYRTSELITSNLKLDDWFHKSVNNDRLFTDHRPLINTDDNQFQHFGLCCAHLVGFVAVIILLSQYFGVRIVEKVDSGDSRRTVFDVLVDPVNIDVVFEFDYIDEYVKRKKFRTKVIKKISTNDSGWKSVGINQSFREKSGQKQGAFLKKRKCASVGPILLEIELPVQSNCYDTNVKKSDGWYSAENKSLKRKESDGNSTSGSYTASYVCVIFIFIYLLLPFTSDFYFSFKNILCPPIEKLFISYFVYFALKTTTIET